MKPKPSISVGEILHHIRAVGRKECTYLIDGRIGPTGKTWLCNQLNESGFKAYEVEEEMWTMYIHRDRSNCYQYLPGNVVIVILNEYLPEDIIRGSFRTNE